MSIKKNLLLDLPNEIIDNIYEYVGPSDEHKKFTKSYEDLYNIYYMFKYEYINLYFRFYDDYRFYVRIFHYNHDKKTIKSTIHFYIKIIETPKGYYHCPDLKKHKPRYLFYRKYLNKEPNFYILINYNSFDELFDIPQIKKLDGS